MQISENICLPKIFGPTVIVIYIAARKYQVCGNVRTGFRFGEVAHAAISYCQRIHTSFRLRLTCLCIIQQQLRNFGSEYETTMFASFQVKSTQLLTPMFQFQFFVIYFVILLHSLSYTKKKLQSEIVWEP